MNYPLCVRRLGLACAVLLLLQIPVSAEVAEVEAKKHIDNQLTKSELEKYSTTAFDLLAQENDLIKVSAVRVNQTEVGVEVVIETAQGEFLQPIISNEGNNFFADIPSAVLALPEGGEFRTANPVEGIALVSVTQLNENTVRVTITGSVELPITELITVERGLVFNATAIAQTPVADEIEVVVTATRTEEEITNVPRSVTIIDREEIEEQLKLTTDLQDILAKTVPGLTPPRQQFYGPTLRGRNALILIDGIPMSGNFSTGFIRDWRTIQPDAIERIEVVRGPSAVYGDGGTGGVINIITRQPQEEFTATTKVGINGSLTHIDDSLGYDIQQLISGTSDQFYAVANFGITTSGDYFDAEGDRIPLFDYGASNSTTINILTTMGVNLTDEQSLELTFNHFNDKQDYSYIFDPIVTTIPGIQKARALRVGNLEYIGTPGPGNQSTFANLKYEHNNLFGSELSFQTYYRAIVNRGAFFDVRPFDPLAIDPVARSVQDSARYGLRLQVDSPVFKTVKVLWGVDYSSETISETYDNFDTEKFDSSGFRVLERVSQSTISPDFTVDSLGLFAQLRWDISEQFLLSAGLRYEQFKVNVPDYVNNNGNFIGGGEIDPSDTVFNAGLVYKITPAFSIYTNFAQGYSLPDIARILRRPPENFDFGRDVNISEPIKVNNYEIGLRGEWENVQASVAVFYSESDLGGSVVFDEPTEPGRLVRAPRRDYGVEAAIDWQPGGGFSLGGTFTYVDGEDDIDDNGVFLALNSFDISPIKLTVYLQHQTTQTWNNRIQLLYVGDRDRAFNDGVDGAPIEGYVVVDLISSVKIGKGTLSLGIENLFNNQYSTVTSQYIGAFDESANFAARGTTFSVNYRIDW